MGTERQPRRCFLNYLLSSGLPALLLRPTTALWGNKEAPPNLGGLFADLPLCRSPNNIKIRPVWAPALPENQPEQPSDASMPDARLGSAGGTAEPPPLSAHQFPVLLVLPLENQYWFSHHHHQKYQPSRPRPIRLSSFHYLFLLLSPITPSLPRNPQQQPSPPNFGLTQPTVIFQANCNCNQLSLFPWGYFNLYKSIISYHDQPAIHLLSKY